MVFLALAVVCSTAIAVLFKLTEGRMDRIALLTVNYLVAFLFAIGVLWSEGAGAGLRPAPDLLALGVGVGVLFIAGFALFSFAIGVAGLSLATGALRLSVAVPFLASWLIWGEEPTGGQLAGLLLAGVAFVLIALRPRAETAADLVPAGDVPVAPSRGPLYVAVVLGVLFVAGGMVDTSFKAFEELFAETTSRALFMLFVFGVACVIGTAFVLRRRVREGVWPKREVIGWGIALGLVNYGSVEFMLLALGSLPGTVVFPANNVAVVALATILGVAIWRERLTPTNWSGLAAAAVALFLLSR